MQGTFVVAGVNSSRQNKKTLLPWSLYSVGEMGNEQINMPAGDRLGVGLFSYFIKWQSFPLQRAEVDV